MAKTKGKRKTVDANARKTSVHFTMRMPKETKKELKRIARERKVTTAQVVVDALGAYERSRTWGTS